MTPGKPDPSFSATFYIVVVIAVLWTIGLAAYFVRVSPFVLLPALGALAAVIPAVLRLFGMQLPKGASIEPHVTRRIVFTVLALDFLATVVPGALAYYQAHRSIDIISRVTFTGNTDVRPGGDPAVLDIPVTESRNGVALTIQARDHNASLGVCRPFTRLGIDPYFGTNPGTSSKVSPGSPVWTRIPPGTKRIRLMVHVVNTRHDQNCAVDLSVTSAHLQNGRPDETEE